MSAGKEMTIHLENIKTKAKIDILDELYENGIITRDDYEKRKSQVYCNFQDKVDKILLSEDKSASVGTTHRSYAI